jgi:hypothetical protein
MVEKKDAYSRLQNLLLQKVVLSMLMKVWMSENQACQSLVHVTAFQFLRVKPSKWGLNRGLKPVLQGWAGSHTLSNHVIGKRMVNTTLAKGHHAQTSRTARNFLLFFSHDSSTPKKLYIIIF